MEAFSSAKNRIMLQKLIFKALKFDCDAYTEVILNHPILQLTYTYECKKQRAPYAVSFQNFCVKLPVLSKEFQKKKNSFLTIVAQ